jgi:capsular exopolysaccharide synthesis family protein
MSASSAQVILNEIRRLNEDKQNGVLALSNNDKRVDVFFREGWIEAASSNIKDHRLGDYLTRDGFIEAHDVDLAQQEAKQFKILLGEAIVRKNLLYASEVSSAVRCQAIDLLSYVFKNGFLIDSFTNSLKSYYAPARVSFPHVLLELSRNNPVPFEPDSTARLSVADGMDLSALPWYPEELSVLSQLKQPNTFVGLVKATGMDGSTVRRILGVLQRLRVLITNRMDEEGVESDSRAVIKNDQFAFEYLIPVVTNAVLSEKLEVARNQSSFTSEQFKNLKVQITEANAEVPLKVFTVSSPDPQDGKSLVSVNLALSFALDPGRRVVIVDCDLRSPSLEKYLGVTSDPGVLQYIENSLGAYCYLRRLDNLYFMTAGGIASNPIEILSMQKMKQLIDDLRKEFDTIILDAPPYSPISDARIVTGLSDGLIMVLRRGKTSYASTDRAFKSVDPKKLLGVVFNDVKPMMFHTYHEFDYYGYGQDRRPYPGSTKSRNTGRKTYLKT